MKSGCLLAGLAFVCMLQGQPAPGTGLIEGRVLHALTGAPVRRATVVLLARRFMLDADTDAEGKFQFSGLPAGTYRLSARRPGFLNRAARGAVSLGDGQSVRDAEIRLIPHGAIAGRVLDEDGEPVLEGGVMVFRQTYRNGRRQWEQVTGARISDTGEYRISGLKRGRYLVQARAAGAGTHSRSYGGPDSPATLPVPTYYQSEAGEEAALPVEVGPGADLQGIDIQLLKVTQARSVHVRGKVTPPPGSNPSVGVTITWAEVPSFGRGTVAMPPDYAFDLSVPPGQYKVFANVYTGGPEAYGNVNLTVTGDVSGVIVAMTPAPVLTGRVSLAGSDKRVKVQGVRVSLEGQPSHLTTQEARSDTAGLLVFGKPFRPGHYTVEVDSVPEGCFVREIKVDGQVVSADGFELSASAQLEIVLSGTAGGISGSVTDEDGNPFPGSSVTLIPVDAQARPARHPVDDDGNFRFTGVRPGKYKVFAWDDLDSELWQDPEYLKNYESRATEITVGPGETGNVRLRAISP